MSQTLHLSPWQLGTFSPFKASSASYILLNSTSVYANPHQPCSKYFMLSPPPLQAHVRITEAARLGSGLLHPAFHVSSAPGVVSTQGGLDLNWVFQLEWNHLCPAIIASVSSPKSTRLAMAPDFLGLLSYLHLSSKKFSRLCPETCTTHLQNVPFQNEILVFYS